MAGAVISAATTPLGDSEYLNRREAAVSGSQKLRDAILVAKGYLATPVHAKPIGDAQIQALVSAHFDISVETLLGPDRSYRIVRPRQVAMFLSRKTTRASLLDIAHQFSGRDHTTVMNAIRRVEQRLADAHSETLEAVWAVHKVIG
jgi:chromosomal replication initiation ATPase DnaA